MFVRERRTLLLQGAILPFVDAILHKVSSWIMMIVIEERTLIAPPPNTGIFAGV
jgi:hypothetical protein